MPLRPLRNRSAPDRPLRVAMIGQKAIPAAYGGVERVVEEVGARLATQGVEVTVYCSPTPAPAPPEHRGMRLVTVREVKGKHLGKLSQAGAATLHALGGHFDVVHFHTIGPCIYAPFVRLLTRARVVATIHGRDDLRAKWSRPARTLLRVAAWSSARVPHRVMVVSDELQADYRATFGVDSVVVPNGMSPVGERGEDVELARWGLEPGSYLLMVGRLVPEKAADVLVEAFAKVSGDTRLVIVGESAFTDAFAEEVRATAEHDPRVVFTGPLYGAPLDALFRSAAAFMLPSRLEGLPVVLLEAVSYGLPVVVSDLPAHLEVVGEDGPGHRVVPVDDPGALADAIETVLGSPEEERSGAGALRDLIRERYSWDRAATLTRAVYETVTSGRRR